MLTCGDRRWAWFSLAVLLGGCIGVGSDAVPVFGTEGAPESTGSDEGAPSVPANPTTGVSASAGPGGTDDTSTDESSGSETDDCVEEICDGVDNNCDDEVDEGCDCVVGTEQACYSGASGTEGVGVCQAGTQTCDSDGWGACDGEVVDANETCDGADNDCDGSVDEDFGEETCGQGICEVTTQTCVEGTPVECTPGEPDAIESCNGLDDNCDGDIDEGCTCLDGETQDCYPGPVDTEDVGLCAAGTQTCEDGAWGSCDGAVTPTGETCDGEDNNCDGVEDDGDPGGGAACNTGLLGVCMIGLTACQGGDVDCVQQVASSAEACNGEDDDCNGLTDDGDPGGGGACDTGLQGVCAAGTEVCSGGGLSCQQDIPASPELCDGDDNDCDAATDEGNPGGGNACDTGLLGECAAGTETCAAGTIDCVEDSPSVPEVCGDGRDNDCNGVTDNGCGTNCVDVVVLDPGFETGTPNAGWTEASTQFGTPLCDVVLCGGTGGGSGPRGGTWWAWFGGFDGYELGSVTQDVTIAAGTVATLTFWLEIPVCAPAVADTLVVTMDGVEVVSFNNADAACGVLGYVEHTADLTAFADGGSHTLEFTGEVFGGGVTNFFVEDVAIESCD